MAADRNELLRSTRQFEVRAFDQAKMGASPGDSGSLGCPNCGNRKQEHERDGVPARTRFGRAGQDKPPDRLIDQLVLDGVGGQLGVVFHPHLLKNPRTVGADSLDTQPKISRDLSGTATRSDLAQDLKFAVREQFVRFFVRVAAEVLTLDSDILIGSFRTQSFLISQATHGVI